VIAKFKDEVGLNYIQQFCGLRPKLYSYTLEDFHEAMKCKGAKKSVVQKYLTFLKYKNMLFYEDMETIKKEGSVNQNIIRSYEHQIYMEQLEKLHCHQMMIRFIFVTIK